MEEEVAKAWVGLSTSWALKPTNFFPIVYIFSAGYHQRFDVSQAIIYFGPKVRCMLTTTVVVTTDHSLSVHRQSNRRIHTYGNTTPHTAISLDVVMDFGKSKIQLDFFLLNFVGLDYFGCGCPHAKLNWMSNQYWMFKHELSILMSSFERGSCI
jgi:hypothetical protein